MGCEVIEPRLSCILDRIDDLNSRMESLKNYFNVEIFNFIHRVTPGGQLVHNKGTL